MVTDKSVIETFIEEWGYTDIELADSMGYDYLGTNDLNDGVFAEYAINCGYRWSSKYERWFNRTVEQSRELLYGFVMQEA